jgi:hypothetical protein
MSAPRTKSGRGWVKMGLIGVALFLAGYWAGGRRPPRVWEPAQALPAPVRIPPCIAPDIQEAAILNLAVRVLEVVQEPINPLMIGAKRQLGRGLYRQQPKPPYLPVCLPDEMLDRARVALSRQRQGGRLVEYELDLAFRLKDPPANVVEAVGKSAFAEVPQQAEFSDLQDIRPLARAVLASFGETGSGWGNIALQKVSEPGSMGTSALQIAVATKQPGALELVERRMQGLLTEVTETGAVRYQAKLRLLELLYALTLAGEAAAPHLEPTYRFLAMKAQAPAPPFGLVELDPKRACFLLARFPAGVLNSIPAYCSDPSVPLEQQ